MTSIFLHSYLLAKTEIFYMLNSFIFLAKRNSFFILKDQFSPVIPFNTDIRLLLTKDNYKITFGTVLDALELQIPMVPNSSLYHLILKK